MISQWIVTVLVTRLYGYSDAGVLSLAMSVSAAFQTVAMFGIRNFQVSDINGKYPDSCYAALRSVTCLAALALCLIFTALNQYSFSQSGSIFLFMIFRLSENYSDVIHGIAQKKGRLDIAGKGFALKGILLLAAFLVGYFLNAELNLCLLLMAAAAWSVTLIFDLTLTEKISRFKLTYSLGECIKLGKNTAPLCLYLFLSSAIPVAPKYILEKMCDEATLGAYSSIFAPALILQAAASYIFIPFVGTFAEYYSQRNYKAFLKLAFKLLLLLTAVFVLCIAAASVLGEWGLTVIFGESIIPHSYLLLPILTAAFFVSAASFIYMLEVVIRDFKNLIIGCGAGLLCCIVVSVPLIGSLGANGASIGMGIGAAVNILYMAVSIFVKFKKNSKSD